MSPSLYQAFPSWLILRKWWNWKLRPLSVPVMATTPISCTPPTYTTSGSLPSPTTPPQTWWGCRVGLRLEAGQRRATHSWCSTFSWVCWPVWTLCSFSTGCWRPRLWASYCFMDSPSTWTSESAKVRQRGARGWQWSGIALWLHAIPGKEADVTVRGSQGKGTFGREGNIASFVINCSALMSWRSDCYWNASAEWSGGWTKNISLEIVKSLLKYVKQLVQDCLPSCHRHSDFKFNLFYFWYKRLCYDCQKSQIQ